MRDKLPNLPTNAIIGVDLSEQGDMTAYTPIKLPFKDICSSSTEAVGTIHDKEDK